MDYDKTSKGIVFTTDRPYQPGEQVNINWKTGVSYIRLIFEKTSTKVDGIQIECSLPKSALCYMHE